MLAAILALTILPGCSQVSSILPNKLLMLWLFAVLTLSGCSYKHEVAPLAPHVRERIGKVDVELGPVQTATNFGRPPSGKGRAALAAAGASVFGGIYAGAVTFNPYGLALFTALGIAIAPFAAAIGAIAVPSTEDVEEASRGLATAIQATDWAVQLQSSVESAMRQRATPGAATNSGRLGLSIEAPWVVVDGTSAIPTLTVHGAMLVDDACVVDRRWRWNGDSDDFIDLGEDDAREFKKQMATGIEELGKAIIADLFLEAQGRRIAYKDQDSFTRGAPPLMVLVPDQYQNRVGSWDVAREGAPHEPQCAGLLSLEAPAQIPQTDSTEHPRHDW